MKIYKWSNFKISLIEQVLMVCTYSIKYSLIESGGQQSAVLFSKKKKKIKISNINIVYLATK